MNLSMLKPLYEGPGPWASVYLDTSYRLEDARQLIEGRWKALDGELAAAGADERTRSAIAASIDLDSIPPGEGGLAIFASHGGVRLRRPLPVAPTTTSGAQATFTPLPRAMTLIEAIGDDVRWMRVTIDRTGADIELDSSSFEVSGSERYPIHKSGQGGRNTRWSAPRHDRWSETNWDRNAREVAEIVTRTVDREAPDVVILVGDVRARQLVHDHLPPRVGARTVEAAVGSRAHGAATDPVDQATKSAVEEFAEHSQQNLLDRYDALAARGRSVEGIDKVTAAARAGALDVLLIDPDEAFMAVFADPSDPGLISTDEGLLREMNARAAISEPAAEALLAAAVVTDAEVTIVHNEPPLADGLGAVIRFPV